MSGWTLPLPATSYQAVTQKATPFDQRSQLGRDLLWKGGLVPTSAGDYAVVDGVKALRQSLLHRLVTQPGEWPLRPTYGVGAVAFVYETLTDARAAELMARINQQFLQDPRVDKVTVNLVSRDDETGELIIKVEVEVKSTRVVLTPFSLPQEANQ